MDTVKIGMSIRLSVHPTFHRYNGAYIGALGIHAICHFTSWDKGLTIHFTSTDMP